MVTSAIRLTRIRASKISGDIDTHSRFEKISGDILLGAAAAGGSLLVVVGCSHPR